MKVVISLSILFVWLLFELKDFFFNGGFNHALAFGLLKIGFIIGAIIIIFLTTLWMNTVPHLYRQIQTKHQKISPNNKSELGTQEYSNINKTFFKKKSF